jgi:hypothetical protein
VGKICRSPEEGEKRTGEWIKKSYMRIGKQYVLRKENAPLYVVGSKARNMFGEL